MPKAFERKALGDLAGPSEKQLAKGGVWTKFETVSCHVCGHEYRSKSSVQYQNRKRGIKPICYDCFKKQDKELQEAIKNLNKKKKTLTAPAKKLHYKARMLGAKNAKTHS